jgi:hypothetical protein
MLNPQALHNVRQAMLAKNMSGEGLYSHLEQAVEAYTEK